MNCIIIDDDHMSVKVLTELINKIDNLYLKDTAPSIGDALKIINNDVDLIFLDLAMPTISGADFIKNFKYSAQIIIVSGFKDFGAEAFDYNITDYLIKPVTFPRFLKAVEKAQRIKDDLQKPNQAEKAIDGETKEFFIKKDSRLIKIAIEDIIYIEAMADYVIIYTPGNRYTLLSTMKAIESTLPEKDFTRIHRSYIINLKHIKEIEDNSVSVGLATLPISRGYKDKFYSKINRI